MALQVTKAVSLTGQSVIEENIVVYLSATVSTESVGNTTISQTIQDAKNYRENRVQCRKDIQAFQDKVYAIEDELGSELLKVPEGAEEALVNSEIGG